MAYALNRLIAVGMDMMFIPLPIGVQPMIEAYSLATVHFSVAHA